MPLYEYTALSDVGKKLLEIVDADTLASAKAKLRKMQIIVTNINLTKKRLKSTVTKQILINFTQELMQLLTSGLPLYESLLTIEENTKAKSLMQFFLICATK